MSNLSEPGGELSEALEGVWREWQDDHATQLMGYNDFLAPELEAALRVTLRHLIKTTLPAHERTDDDAIKELIDSWVLRFAETLKDKRSR